MSCFMKFYKKKYFDFLEKWEVFSRLDTSKALLAVVPKLITLQRRYRTI